MKFRHGRYRFVFAFPLLGIAIKFPVIRLFSVAWNIIKHLAHLRVKYVWHEAMIEVDCYYGYRNWLFGGIVANWREFVFFRKTKHSFLQPTYFSLFGLFNIQKVAEPCQLQAVDLWCQLYELTNGKVFADSHHFENPDNFCLAGGVLRILDYGSKRTHGVITEFGDKILNSFDPKFDWEEKKKAIAAQRQQSAL